MLMLNNLVGFGASGVPTVEVLIEIWGASGAGGSSVGAAKGGAAGGIMAFRVRLPVGTVLDLAIGGRGLTGSSTTGIGGNGGTNGGGKGGNNTAGNQSGGGGGGYSAVRLALTLAMLGRVGGGGGGAAYSVHLASYPGRPSSAGGSLTEFPSGGSGSPGGDPTAGAAGGNESSGSGGGGGGGGGGEEGGGPASTSSGGHGGTGLLGAGCTRDGTAEAAMTPKAGGPAGVGGNGTNGQNGQIRITDGSGATTYSSVAAFGTYTHTVTAA